MSRLVFAAALLLGMTGCGGTTTVTTTVARTVTVTTTVVHVTTASAAPTAAPCAADSLTGTFSVIPGSAGAGQIGYRLRLENTSGAACVLSGLPTVQLLGRNGAELPTDASPAQPGQSTSGGIVLQHGDAVRADARFSPDIPGGSEPQDAPCEPKAYTLRVTIGGGAVDAPLTPPTPVCERGSLSFSNLTPAG